MTRKGHGDYPQGWREYATQLKEEAGWKCVRCQHPHDPPTGYTLTVHHLTMNKAEPFENWWAFAPLCQRCHLQIQAKVVMEQVYMFEHSTWFKPFAAGYYAYRAGLPHDRESVMTRLDEYLSLALTTNPPSKQPYEAQPEIWKIDNGHYQVRMTDGDIISNHSDRQGAERMIEKMKKAQPYTTPRLTRYGTLNPTTTPA